MQTTVRRSSDATLFQHLARIRHSAYSNSAGSSPAPFPKRRGPQISQPPGPQASESQPAPAALFRFALLLYDLITRTRAAKTSQAALFCFSGPVLHATLAVFRFRLQNIQYLPPLPSAYFRVRQDFPQTRFPDYAPWVLLPRDHGELAADCLLLGYNHTIKRPKSQAIQHLPDHRQRLNGVISLRLKPQAVKTRPPLDSNSNCGTTNTACATITTK